jgi:elongation factor P--beta-lysine ligase
LKVTSSVLKSFKMQISKYPCMTAGQLRATVPDLAALSDCSVQCSLQKDLKMPSPVAALKPLLTMKRKKRLAFCRKYRNWMGVDWE